MEKFPEQLQPLLKQERQNRIDDNIDAQKQLFLKIVEEAREIGGFKLMIDVLVFLVKRRGQIKQAITTVVQHFMGLAANLMDDSEKLQLLNCLREITKGKIFLEHEHADITRQVANLYEQQSDVKNAVNALQEVHVETYGSLNATQKADFLLHQMRLLLISQDFIRVQIVSRKVNMKLLANLTTHKVQFLQYMSEYHTNEKAYFEVAKCWLQILNCIESNKAPILEITEQNALSNLIMYALLSEYNAEQQDLLLNIKRTKEIETPMVKQLLEDFLTWELMTRPSQETIHFETLLRRVNQHNIRVIGKYYSRIQLNRLAQLLQISEEEVELELRDLVSYQGYKLKIDRPNKQVDFCKEQTVASELNNWNSDLSQLLNKIEDIVKLIERES